MQIPGPYWLLGVGTRVVVVVAGGSDAVGCQGCNCCSGLSLPSLTVFLLEGEEGAYWGSWTNVIGMGEWEGPRSNRAGRC